MRLPPSVVATKLSPSSDVKGSRMAWSQLPCVHSVMIVSVSVVPVVTESPPIVVSLVSLLLVESVVTGTRA